MNKYIILHKPWGVLSQFTSEPGHRNLSEFNLPPAVYAVGRLDKDSEGLLLLSNDGQFNRDFIGNHPRIYWAQVEGEPKQSDLELLGKGVKLKDGMSLPCDISFLPLDIIIPPRNPPIRDRKSIATTWIRLVLKEGRNRQVRRMTAAIGYPTLRLVRAGLGKLEFNPFTDLKAGTWKDIAKEDLI